MIVIRAPLQRTRLQLWTAACLTACVIGLALAVGFGTACDGGRGGAVAVALAFSAYFTSRPVAEDLIEAPDESGAPNFDKKPSEERISRLRSAIAVILDRQRLEARYLTVASVSGTLVWGFGDWIAGWLGAPAC